MVSYCVMQHWMLSIFNIKDNCLQDPFLFLDPPLRAITSMTS